MKTAVDEAERQAAFLRLLAEADDAAVPLCFTEPSERVAAGLRAYRRNASAVADRALAVVFPTLRDLLGADDFTRLADEFRRSNPPVRGDLGEWGAALADFVGSHPGLRAWPWLADCARLDLAVHRNERAADAQTDRDSLRLLTEVDPADLCLVLMPGTAVLRSDWPIATRHRVHRPPAGGPPDAVDAAPRAVVARRGESVMIVRSGWRAISVGLDAPTCAFTAAVLAGASLAAALDRAGEGFDFASWLPRAVGECWLWRVEPVPGGPDGHREGDVE